MPEDRIVGERTDEEIAGLALAVAQRHITSAHLLYYDAANNGGTCRCGREWPGGFLDVFYDHRNHEAAMVEVVLGLAVQMAKP